MAKETVQFELLESELISLISSTFDLIAWTMQKILGDEWKRDENGYTCPHGVIIPLEVELPGRMLQDIARKSRIITLELDGVKYLRAESRRAHKAVDIGARTIVPA